MYEIAYKLKTQTSIRCNQVLICFQTGINCLSKLTIPPHFCSIQSKYLDNIGSRLGTVSLNKSGEKRTFKSIALETICLEKLIRGIAETSARMAKKYLHMTVVSKEGYLADVFCNDLKYLSNHFGNSQAGSHSEEYILECISLVSFFNYESSCTNISFMIAQAYKHYPRIDTLSLLSLLQMTDKGLNDCVKGIYKYLDAISKRADGESSKHVDKQKRKIMRKEVVKKHNKRSKRRQEK